MATLKENIAPYSHFIQRQEEAIEKAKSELQATKTKLDLLRNAIDKEFHTKE